MVSWPRSRITGSRKSKYVHRKAFFLSFVVVATSADRSTANTICMLTRSVIDQSHRVFDRLCLSTSLGCAATRNPPQHERHFRQGEYYWGLAMSWGRRATCGSSIPRSGCQENLDLPCQDPQTDGDATFSCCELAGRCSGKGGGLSRPVVHPIAGL